MDEHVVREVAVGTGDGVMRGRVAVRTGPMSLSGLVATAVELTTALSRRAEQLVVLQGRSISCGPGCGACCRHMVPVSPPEAFHLLDVLEQLPEPGRAAVRRRFDEVDGAVQSAGLVADLLDPELTPDPVLPVARKYFALQEACPFLVDESCGIHRERPVACRDYSVTSPASLCVQPYDSEIEKVPMPLPLSVPLARAAGAAAGIRPQLVPLTLVPRWAAEHAELRRRTWPGVELFDAFLAELHALYPESD